MNNDKNNAAPDPQPAELAEQQGVELPPLPRMQEFTSLYGRVSAFGPDQMREYALAALAATGKQQVGEVQVDGLATIIAALEHSKPTHDHYPEPVKRHADALAHARVLAAHQPVHVQGSNELRARTDGERAAYREGVEEGTKIAARQPAAWNSMDTAPKDGTEILIEVELRAGVGGRCLVGHYMRGGHCIEDHPPIAEGWYFWNGCAFDKAAKPIRWRHIQPAQGIDLGPVSIKSVRQFIADRTPNDEYRENILSGDYDHTAWFDHIRELMTALNQGNNS